MQISDRETSILLGATLMHWGVPFHSAAKRELSDHQKELADQASDKLIAARAVQTPSPFRVVDLSDSEIALLVEIVHNCVEECGNNSIDLRLHLQAGDRREVEALIAHLQSCLPSAESASRQ